MELVSNNGRVDSRAGVVSGGAMGPRIILENLSKEIVIQTILKFKAATFAIVKPEAWASTSSTPSDSQFLIKLYDQMDPKLEAK